MQSNWNTPQKNFPASAYTGLQSPPWQAVETSVQTQGPEAYTSAENNAQTVPLPKIKKSGNLWSRLPRRRRIILVVSSVVLVVLVGGGVLAATLLQSLSDPNNLLSIPPTIQMSIDEQALNVLSAKNTAQNPTVSDLNIVPMPGNTLQIHLNMNINSNGIHSVLPVEIDSSLAGNSQQTNIVTVQRVTLRGVDAGPGVAARVQATVNNLLKPGPNHIPSPVTPNDLVGSIQQSNTRVCGHGSMLLHLGLHMKTQGQAIPINVDGYVGLNQQHMQLFHLERAISNGKDITGLASNFVNPILKNAPLLFEHVQILSLGTSTQFVCGHNDEMLVVQLGPAPGNN